MSASSCRQPSKKTGKAGNEYAKERYKNSKDSKEDGGNAKCDHRVISSFMIIKSFFISQMIGYHFFCKIGIKMS